MEEEDDFIYIATPLCEYNLVEIVEQKLCPRMTGDHHKIKMCNSLLNGMCQLC